MPGDLVGSAVAVEFGLGDALLEEPGADELAQGVAARHRVALCWPGSTVRTASHWTAARSSKELRYGIKPKNYHRAVVKATKPMARMAGTNLTCTGVSASETTKANQDMP